MDATQGDHAAPFLGLCAGYANGMRCPGQVVVRLASIPVCDKHRIAVGRAVAMTSDEVPFVYYLGDPVTQLVKIGFTTMLKKRVSSLRRCRPDVVLLATEPGGRSVERSRHRQFRHLRRRQGPETEWFRRCPELMEHVSQVRARHGIEAAQLRVPLAWIAGLRMQPTGT